MNRHTLTEIGLPAGTLLIAVLATFAPFPAALPATFEHGLDFAAIVLIFATVFVVLRHAETVAHHVGEPFGTLVLTLAVTAIEASVIISLMLDGSEKPTLARESVFSTVMIICAGVVGACLTLGGWRHVRQDLKRQGTSAFLSMLIALAGFTLVLPNFTLTGRPGEFSHVQLAFIATLAFLLYVVFVIAQTRRYRGDFVEDLRHETMVHPALPERSLPASLVLLVAGLAGIVMLTEIVAHSVEESLIRWQIEHTEAIIGAFIATLVLMPESISAVKAALRNELQRGLNIALGSACATIGLTVPLVAVASLISGRELDLGLVPGDIALLTIALATCMVSFSTGRTTLLTGLVHLVIFFAYLLLIAVP
ncbi:ionic transporter [Rhizobiaceae bacterium BDR2-2]|uniref:Ionic transporter n=1 Tax=Ectorhizobium quercum TaxID=2965071 RepID=A0AAE3N3Q5_9HYPH|nr:ionic transporter [Ectorhizobium quercum]MCX8999387.1 ionic transporter [Ectorhizobium quercum]